MITYLFGENFMFSKIEEEVDLFLTSLLQFKKNPFTPQEKALVTAIASYNPQDADASQKIPSIISQSEKYHRLPLMTAAVFGKLEIFKALITKTKDPELFCTLLELAAEKGHLSIVKFILSKHDLGFYEHDALCFAAQKGYFEIVDCMLNHRVEPNVKKTAYTPAMMTREIPDGVDAKAT